MAQGTRPGSPSEQASRALRETAPRVRWNRLAALSASLAIAWERFWPLAIHAACVVLVFLSVSWIGLWRGLEDPVRYALLLAFAVALAWALAGLRRFAWPGREAVIRRVETASGLHDRPLAAQYDTLSMGGEDKFANALWREHRRRMAARLETLTGGVPAADANRTDPWAMRAGLACLAFAAFGYSLGPDGGGPSDAFRTAASREQALTRLDAWINPPAYTRKPPIYLSGSQELAGDAPIQAPQGSELFLRYVGRAEISAEFRQGDKRVAIAPVTGDAEDGKPVAASAAGEREPETAFTQKLEESGSVAFLSGGALVRQWPIEIVPDTPPTIRFSEAPSAALSGSLQLAYEVEDDYGVTAAEAGIRSNIAQAPDARPLVGPPEIALPLPRQRARSGGSRVNRDVTAHPWAGSSVTIRLKASDDAGQSGESEDRTMILPGRRFTNPLALALLEQRRILALDAKKAHRVADLLDAVLTAPEELLGSPGAFLAMKVAWRRIVSARDDDTLRSALDLLWETALAIEFGDLSDAERKLREAQENLSKALEEGASPEEIERLMQELRQAMNDYMEQLMQEAMRNPASPSPFDDSAMNRTLRQSDLERMMDRIEDLAKSGSQDAARQLLSEMQRMMDNLRAGRHQQQRQQEGNRMNQALDKLSELMRQQQELMDRTFDMQRRNPQGEEGQRQQNRQGQQGGQQEMTPEEFADALKQLQEQQEALREQLEALGDQLESLGLDPSEQFGEAGKEMGDAGKKLGQGRPGEATGDQGQALEALRRGVQSMMQQMAGDRQQGGQRNGQGQAGQDRQRADPLGRQQGEGGLNEDANANIPGEIDTQRAREIMEAIRKRLGKPNGPVIEKRYLERLLDTQ